MSTHSDDRLSTGIQGLDDVLSGGLIPRRTYMIRGQPGAGKTLFGLQFLRAGLDVGDDALFIALEESAGDIRENAAAVGMDVSAVDFVDLSPGSDFFVEDRSYDIFSPDEVEGDSLTASISGRIEDHDPDRIVLDPATQLRYLAPDDYQFRKQVLSLVRFLREQGATVVFTSQATAESPDDALQFISDGVIDLRHAEDERSLGIPKFRGSDAQSGRHAYRISADGIAVHPELLPGEYTREFTPEPVPSGVPEIDELLGGGLSRGTVTIISGPTGVGKTTLGTQFMKEAAGRGERSVIYLFEENRATFLERSEAVSIPVHDMLERGTLAIDEVEPLQNSPEAFADGVRDEVEENGSEIVMLDGVDGYRMSLHGEERDITRRLHSLGRYLKNMGVTVILVDETGSVTGEFEASSENISYLADNIVFLRYLELDGELRKAIGVLKQRTSDFERTLREFDITRFGLKVGEPLTGLRGILTGSPEWTSNPAETGGPARDGE